jgi:hypothetical protein
MEQPPIWTSMHFAAAKQQTVTSKRQLGTTQLDLFNINLHGLESRRLTRKISSIK